MQLIAGADTYLLDDPLSAVDAHVGQHLFQECICGALAASTRILVTHQLQFLPSADLVLVLAGGRIAHAGTYSALTAAGVEFRCLPVSPPNWGGPWILPTYITLSADHPQSLFLTQSMKVGRTDVTIH